MKDKVRVTFRNMDPSSFVEARVREAAAKLDEFKSRIQSCHVVIDSRHRHHHKGNLFQVRIDLVVPGSEIVVSRNPENDHAHEDVYVAIRDAFDAARRRLQGLGRRRRGGGEDLHVPDAAG